LECGGKATALERVGIADARRSSAAASESGGFGRRTPKTADSRIRAHSFNFVDVAPS
jgi:hypothetical protein